MIRFAFFSALLSTLVACGNDELASKTTSTRGVPPAGSINAFGQVHVRQTRDNGYVLTVTPFKRRAIYKINISTDSSQTTECKKYESDSSQTLSVQMQNLSKDYLHFARVCVYFDEGDSGATNLVLANDELFVPIAPGVELNGN